MLDIQFQGTDRVDRMVKGLFMSLEAINQEMVKAMSSLGNFMAERLRLNTPVGATKRLAASTMVTTTLRKAPIAVGPTQVYGSEVVTVISQPAISQPRIGVPITYRTFVVRGRRPGRRPPYQNLHDWVMAKWGLASEKEINAKAFALAKVIGQQGTNPNPYPLYTLSESAGEIQRTADMLGINIVARLTDFIGVQR